MHIMTVESELRLGSGLPPGRQTTLAKLARAMKLPCRATRARGQGLLVPCAPADRRFEGSVAASLPGWFGVQLALGGAGCCLRLWSRSQPPRWE
jgi:hypothetical protein